MSTACTASTSSGSPRPRSLPQATSPPPAPTHCRPAPRVAVCLPHIDNWRRMYGQHAIRGLYMNESFQHFGVSTSPFTGFTTILLTRLYVSNDSAHPFFRIVLLSTTNAILPPYVKMYTFVSPGSNATSTVLGTALASLADLWRWHRTQSSLFCLLGRRQ